MIRKGENNMSKYGEVLGREIVKGVKNGELDEL